MALVYILDRFATDVIAILSNESPKACPFWEDAHTEQLESALLTYEFSTSAEHDDSDKIVAENHVIIQDRDGSYVLFQIKRVEDEIQNGAHIKRVYSENVAVGDLFGSVIRPTTQNGVAADDVLAYVLQGTGWSVGLTEWEGIQSFDWQSYPTVLAAVQEIGTKFSGDLRFRVEFNNGEVGRKYIDLRPRGSATGVRFEYRVNMNGVKRTEDSTDLVTALIGVGKADDKGVRMTFKDLTASDKPVGQDFIEDEAALQRWGKTDGRHIMGVYDDGDADSPTALLERTRAELAKRNRPRMTYELDAILLETLTGYEHMKVRLGDTVTVKDTGFNPYLAISARVIELVRSYADPRQDRVTLGEFKPLSIDTNAVIRKLEDTIARQAGVWEAAGSGEMIYKSTTAPTDKTVDMLWLNTSGVPEVLQRWNGTGWVRTTPQYAADVGAEPVIIKSSTDPGQASNRLWLDISKVPNILYRSNGAAWRKLTPTEAAEVNAETPAGAQTKADTAKQGAIDAAALDAQTKANAAQAAAATEAQAKADLAEANAKAHADGIVTTEEQARIDQAAANLATAQADAQTKADAAQAAAIAASETAIAKGPTAPTSPAPVTGDLWLDTSGSFATFKKYDGSAWVKMTPTAASEVGAETPTGAQTKANGARDTAKTYTDDTTGNLLNNPAKSGTLAKWSSWGYTSWTIDATQQLNGVAVKSQKLDTTGDSEVYSARVAVDVSKGYEVSAWIKQNAQTAASTTFGGYCYDDSGAQINLTEVDLGSGATNPTAYASLYSGNVLPLGTFQKFASYVFPYGTDPNSIKGLGLNCQRALILPANAATIAIRFITYGNAGAAQTIWLTQMNLQELGSTQLTMIQETKTGAQAKADAARDAAKNAVANGEVVLPTTKLTGAISVATNKLQTTDAKMYWDDGGLVLIDPANGNNRVRITSSGIGVSTDAGATFGNALTSAGLVAEKITGSKISGVMLETTTDLTVGNNIKMGFGYDQTERKLEFATGVDMTGQTGTVWSGITINGQSLDMKVDELYIYSRMTMETNSMMNAAISGQQNLGTNVWEKVKYATVYSDAYSEFDTVNNRFVMSSGGTYMIEFNMNCMLPATGSNLVAAAVYKNGVEYARGFQANGLLKNTQLHGTQICFNCAAQDYIEIFVISGAAGAYLINNASYTHFKVWRLG